MICWNTVCSQRTSCNPTDPLSNFICYLFILLSPQELSTPLKISEQDTPQTFSLNTEDGVTASDRNQQGDCSHSCLLYHLTGLLASINCQILSAFITNFRCLEYSKFPQDWLSPFSPGQTLSWHSRDRNNKFPQCLCLCSCCCLFTCAPTSPKLFVLSAVRLVGKYIFFLRHFGWALACTGSYPQLRFGITWLLEGRKLRPASAFTHVQTKHLENCTGSSTCESAAQKQPAVPCKEGSSKCLFITGFKQENFWMDLLKWL